MGARGSLARIDCDGTHANQCHDMRHMAQNPPNSLKLFLLFASKVPKFEFFVLFLFPQVLPSPVRVILIFVKLRILLLPINFKY